MSYYYCGLRWKYLNLNGFRCRATCRNNSSFISWYACIYSTRCVRLRMRLTVFSDLFEKAYGCIAMSTCFKPSRACRMGRMGFFLTNSYSKINKTKQKMTFWSRDDQQTGIFRMQPWAPIFLPLASPSPRWIISSILQCLLVVTFTFLIFTLLLFFVLYLSTTFPCAQERVRKAWYVLWWHLIVFL